MRPPRWILVFSALGLIGVGAGAIGIYPLLIVAGWFSSHASLSPEFTALLQTEQIRFSALLVGLPLFFWIVRFIFAHGWPEKIASWRGHRIALATAIAIVTFCVQGKLFDHVPHMTDAITHVYQAKLICAGKMTAPLPPCPASFRAPNLLMTADGRAFSKYPPGQALIFAAAMKTGLLEWTGPILSAIAGWCLMSLLARIGGAMWGLFGGILYLFSPLAILLGASFMTHTTFLACMLGALLALVRALEPGSPSRVRIGGLVAGFLIGYAALLRPPDLAGALVSMAVGWLLLVKNPIATKLRIAPWVVIGAAPVSALMMWWNHALYGSWLTVGYGVTKVASLFPVYQGHFGWHEGFTFRTSLIRAAWIFYRFDSALFGWPSSLLILPLAIFFAPRRKLVVACFVTVFVFVGLFLPYDYFGEEYEARYYSPLIPVCIALALFAARVIVSRGDESRAMERKIALGSLIAAFQIFSVIAYWPAHLWPHYGHDYEGTTPSLVRAAAAKLSGPSVVLLDENSKRGAGPNTGLLFNDPWLSNRVIFAAEMPGGVACLAAQFKDRKLYRSFPEPSGGFRFEPVVP